MGGDKSKQNEAEDEDYRRFILEKSKRDQALHQKISTTNGTAFSKLQSQDKNSERQSKSFVDRKSVSDPKVAKEFNVVLNRQGSFIEQQKSQKSDNAMTTEALINDPKHAWVKQLLIQLD